MEKKSIRSFLVNELRDLLNSEEQIVKALPKMIQAADSKELKESFRNHLEETRKQVQRLKKIFRLMKIEKRGKFCAATRELIQGCRGVLAEFRRKSALRDAALISKVQRFKHYEISAYGTACTFAKELGLFDVADLLRETLEEESGADSKLTRIAKGWAFRIGINRQAHVEWDNATDAELKSKFFKVMKHVAPYKKAA